MLAPSIIRELTELRRVPLVPEIRLHLADEPVSAWQRVEQAAGRTGLDRRSGPSRGRAGRRWPATSSTIRRRPQAGR